jgi:hypothetical protein
MSTLTTQTFDNQREKEKEKKRLKQLEQAIESRTRAKNKIT